MCKRCLYLCSNKLEEFTNDISNIIQSIPESDGFSLCKFCFGLLNISHLNEKIAIIKDQLKEYDYKNYKIITNFSCLFTLFNTYLKLKIASMLDQGLIVKNSNIHIENIHTTTLRKCFKPLLTPLLSSIIEKVPNNNNGDISIIISFNFQSNAYITIAKFFSLLNPEQHQDLIINESDDISQIKQLLNTILNPVLLKSFDDPHKFNWNDITLDISFKLKSDEFYIKGNYIKFSRELSQTRWHKNGIKLSASSVDEEIKKGLVKYFTCDANEECHISAGGREDRDVRMLGNGRSFIYKITNARKRYDINYAELTTAINSLTEDIKVTNMGHCSKGEFNTLAKCSKEKIKKYLCVIWCEKPFNESDIKILEEMKNVKIIQKTPLRVIHKRAMMIREKEIIKMNIDRIINEHFFTLEVVASAGTYIKEFVHSDLGRTEPSIMSLLQCECDIIQLDVLDIIY